jgi:hypothetical protein
MIPAHSEPHQGSANPQMWDRLITHLPPSSYRSTDRRSCWSFAGRPAAHLSVGIGLSSEQISIACSSAAPHPRRACRDPEPLWYAGLSPKPTSITWRLSETGIEPGSTVVILAMVRELRVSVSPLKPCCVVPNSAEVNPSSGRPVCLWLPWISRPRRTRSSLRFHATYASPEKRVISE